MRPSRPCTLARCLSSEVLDLRGFNLNAKLDIDPDFLKEDDDHDHSHCDHDHGHCDHEHGWP